jgi:hypothetical protein|tara:strand:- start:450 stop:1070 length:621 start_codon:yes stop_codon:yes gene_type:complete
MINNYGELQAAIASWLKRSELVNDIPGFISLAEDRFNRVIRTTEMETRSQANADNEYIGVPADFLQVRAIRFMGNINRLLRYYSPAELTAFKASGQTGNPTAYTVEDRQFKLFPAPTSSATAAIEIDYLAKIPALSDTNTTNWLLTDHSDIYLFGSLVNAESFLYNDSRVPLWQARLDQAISELTVQEGKARVGAAALMPTVRNIV